MSIARTEKEKKRIPNPAKLERTNRSACRWLKLSLCNHCITITEPLTVAMGGSPVDPVNKEKQRQPPPAPRQTIRKRCMLVPIQSVGRKVQGQLDLLTAGERRRAQRRVLNIKLPCPLQAQRLQQRQQHQQPQAQPQHLFNSFFQDALIRPSDQHVLNNNRQLLNHSEKGNRGRPGNLSCTYTSGQDALRA